MPKRNTVTSRPAGTKAGGDLKQYNKLKAAIYIRVSTQYQVDRASLPVQREELINYARYALGIEEYDVFEDAG